MAISILNYYEQPDGKNLMIMADDLYERNPGEAPDDNMPMDPTNYAISQNLGIPADGSITIVRDFDENKKVKTVTNVFKEGEWKDSTDGNENDIKLGYLEYHISGGSKYYYPEDLLDILKNCDMLLVKYQDVDYPEKEYIGYVCSFITLNLEMRFEGPTVGYIGKDVETEISGETEAEIIDLLKTKFSKQIKVSYT